MSTCSKRVMTLLEELEVRCWPASKTLRLPCQHITHCYSLPLMAALFCMHLSSWPCDLQVPYELVTVDFKSQEHKSPAFKKMQPFGKVCR